MKIVCYPSVGRCPECNGELYQVVPEDENAEPLQRCEDCEETFLILTDGRMPPEGMLHFRPMLAASFPEKNWAASPLLRDPRYVIERKLNGDRALCVVTPRGGQFFSRTLGRNTGLPAEHTAKVPHLSLMKWPEVTIFDGEMVAPMRQSHTETGVRLRCKSDKALARQEELGKLAYVVFDVLVAEGEDVRGLSLDERYGLRDDLFAALVKQHWGGMSRVFRLVPSGTGVDYVKRQFAEGHEGVILKDRCSEYQSDGRPAGVWMKVKESETFDLFITGYQEAETVSEKVDGRVSRTKYAGLVGSLELAAWDRSGPVHVCYASGIPDAIRKEISRNRGEFLNRVVEVKCQCVTSNQRGTLSLQHPRVVRWRDDKRPRDCSFEAIKNRRKA